MYAAHLRAIKVDFALNVRHSLFPLARMRREDPKLMDAFLAAADSISAVQPLQLHEREVLEHYFHGFHTSEASVFVTFFEGRYVFSGTFAPNISYI